MLIVLIIAWRETQRNKQNQSRYHQMATLDKPRRPYFRPPIAPPPSPRTPQRESFVFNPPATPRPIRHRRVHHLPPEPNHFLQFEDGYDNHPLHYEQHYSHYMVKWTHLLECKNINCWNY